MSIRKILRVTCDNCGAWVNVNTGSSSEAGMMLEKRNWIFQRTDFYGNEVQFCNDECQKQFWKKLDIVPEKF